MKTSLNFDARRLKAAIIQRFPQVTKSEVDYLTARAALYAERLARCIEDDAKKKLADNPDIEPFETYAQTIALVFTLESLILNGDREVMSELASATHESHCHGHDDTEEHELPSSPDTPSGSSTVN